MPRLERFRKLAFAPRYLSFAAVAFALLSPLCGCVLVGGYRSGSGFFVWPGTIVIFLVALVVIFLLRRR
jgi:hypothetical protein